MRWLLLITLFTSGLFLSAQQLVDLSGEWVGHSTFMKTEYHVTHDILQSGSQLEGTATTVSLDRKDSIVISFSGVIIDKRAELTGSKVLFKKGTGCMSNSTLTFSTTDENDLLSGTWKGDMRLSTCAPLVGGDVRLYRSKQEETTPASKQPVETALVTGDDYLGQAMLSRLELRDYYALVIGVQEYKDPSIEQLEHPIQDAENLLHVLTSHYGFAAENTVLLANPSRALVIKAFDDMRRRVSKEDQFLVFYAGHGVWEEELNQGYWLPSDAAMDNKSNWISNSTIRDCVRGMKAKHTLLIADACFSGGILRERAVFDNARAMVELYKMPSRKAMTSGTLKTVPDKSVFMQYLLKSLRQNDQPLLSADQLFRKFKIAVINNSPNAQVPQFGPIQGAGDEGGEFIFTRETDD